MIGEVQQQAYDSIAFDMLRTLRTPNDFDATLPKIETRDEFMFNEQVTEGSERFVQLLRNVNFNSMDSCAEQYVADRRNSELNSVLSFSSMDCQMWESLDGISSCGEEGTKLCNASKPTHLMYLEKITPIRENAKINPFHMSTNGNSNTVQPQSDIHHSHNPFNTSKFNNGTQSLIPRLKLSYSGRSSRSNTSSVSEQVSLAGDTKLNSAKYIPELNRDVAKNEEHVMNINSGNPISNRIGIETGIANRFFTLNEKKEQPPMLSYKPMSFISQVNEISKEHILNDKLTIKNINMLQEKIRCINNEPLRSVHERLQYSPEIKLPFSEKRSIEFSNNNENKKKRLTEGMKLKGTTESETFDTMIYHNDETKKLRNNVLDIPISPHEVSNMPSKLESKNNNSFLSNHYLLQGLQLQTPKLLLEQEKKSVPPNVTGTSLNDNTCETGHVMKSENYEDWNEHETYHFPEETCRIYNSIDDIDANITEESTNCLSRKDFTKNSEEEMRDWAKKYLTKYVSQSSSLAGSDYFVSQQSPNVQHLGLEELEFSTEVQGVITQPIPVTTDFSPTLYEHADFETNNSSYSSSDSITYVFVGQDEDEINMCEQQVYQYSSLPNSASIDSLDKTAVQSKLSCTSPRTLSMDSLVAEELLTQLRNGELPPALNNHRNTPIEYNLQQDQKDLRETSSLSEKNNIIHEAKYDVIPIKNANNDSSVDCKSHPKNENNASHFHLTHENTSLQNTSPVESQTMVADRTGEIWSRYYKRPSTFSLFPRSEGKHTAESEDNGKLLTKTHSSKISDTYCRKLAGYSTGVVPKNKHDRLEYDTTAISMPGDTYGTRVNAITHVLEESERKGSFNSKDVPSQTKSDDSVAEIFYDKQSVSSLNDDKQLKTTNLTLRVVKLLRKIISYLEKEKNDIEKCYHHDVHDNLNYDEILDIESDSTRVSNETSSTISPYKIPTTSVETPSTTVDQIILSNIPTENVAANDCCISKPQHKSLRHKRLRKREKYLYPDEVGLTTSPISYKNAFQSLPHHQCHLNPLKTPANRIENTRNFHGSPIRRKADEYPSNKLFDLGLNASSVDTPVTKPLVRKQVSLKKGIQNHLQKEYPDKVNHNSDQKMSPKLYEKIHSKRKEETVLSSSEDYLSSLSSTCAYSHSSDSGTCSGRFHKTHSTSRSLNTPLPKKTRSKRLQHSRQTSTPCTSCQNTSADSGAFFMESPIIEEKPFLGKTVLDCQTNMPRSSLPNGEKENFGHFNMKYVAANKRKDFLKYEVETEQMGFRDLDDIGDEYRQLSIGTAFYIETATLLKAKRPAVAVRPTYFRIRT